MKRDQIIKLAREAGFMFHDAGFAPILHTTPKEYSERCFERFAAAIRAATKEEDARICEDSQDRGPDNGCCPTYWNESLEYAIKAIRASK